jgi:hypothetical protein
MMDDGKIDVSESGIVISYRRFLSDSASGFIFITCLIIIYYPSILYPDTGLEDHARDALYVLLFLISTPIGLAINAVSYFSLDALVHYFERRIFINSLFNKNWLINLADEKFPGIIAGAVGSFFKTGVVDEFIWDRCKDRGCLDMWCKNKSRYSCFDNCYNFSDKDDQVCNFYRFTNCIVEMMHIHYFNY